MQKFTRRGLASFGVAALLVLAPITATAAYADDEVVVADAPVEVVVEAPVEVVAEAPVEVVAEAPAEIAAPDESADAVLSAPGTSPEAASNVDTELAEEETAATVSESLLVAPAAARAAAVTPTYGPGHGAFPIWVSVAGSVITASWAPATDGAPRGYYYHAYDFNGSYAATGTTMGTTFTATLIAGHQYEVYFYNVSNSRTYGDVHFFFTPVVIPAPNAPTNVAADRLPTADGLSLSWDAPVENASNPVTGYSIDVTSNRNTTTYTTTDLSYDFTGLSVGDSYNFAVTAVAADGQVSGIATAEATLEAIAPTAVQNVSLARTGGVLTASWAEPTYNGGSEVGSYDIGLRANGILTESYTATTAGSLVLDEPAGYEVDYTVDVTATNDAGLTSTVTTSASVMRPAVTPTTPVVTAERVTTSSAYTVTWTESTAGDAPMTGYSVSLYNTADDSIISTGTVSPTSRSTTLAVPSAITWGDGLRFDVVAIAENGLSSVTGSAYAGFEAVAPSAVRNLELTRDGDDLVADWDAPAYDGGIGIMWYYVDLYADGVLANESRTFDGDTTLVLSGAAEYSIEYTVKVVPLGDGGIYGPVAESNPVERANFAPTTPSSFGMAYGYKEPLVYASWDFAPQEGSAVESVTVTLYNADGSIAQQETLSVLDGRTGTNFSGLTNDTSYSIGVVATNAAGSSTESARTEVRTNALVPPAATEEGVVALPNYNNVTVSLTGTELTAHVDGVAAGEWVFGYAYSTPSPLGWAQVDANGFAHWSIAGAGLATGATHTLAVQNNFGAPLGFATFAIAADASTAALAHTGSDADTVLLLAAAMLALGAVLMVRRRVRIAL